MGDERGQVTVELLAIVPLLAVAALAATAILAHAGADERAGEAAHAAAIALLEEEDPRAAARAALADDERRRARITIDGRRVIVRLPRPSGLARLAGLGAAEASADAGPEPPR
jgi:hypothetical protein